MNVQEIKDLQEAYLSVYAQQELTEEVEIATEYFYEMGLNEHGIDILIEELGVEEFVEWVDEIAEEYTLNEATRLQRDGGKLKGPKGSRPQSTTKAREKAQGGVTIRIRKKAAKVAVKKQPETQETPKQEKQGIAGRIAAAKEFLQRGVERHQQAVGDLKKKVEPAAQTAALTAKTAGLAAKRAAQVSYAAGQHLGQTPAGKSAKKHGGQLLQRAGKALRDRAAQDTEKVRNWLTKEEYDYILSHLLDEGYANDSHGAEVILMNMSEDWALEVLDEANKAETMLGLTSRQRERARNLNQYTDKPIFYGTNPNRKKKPDNSDPILNRAHKGMTKKRQAAHKATRNQRGDLGAPSTVVKSRYQANKDHEDGYPSITKRGEGPG